MNDFQFEVDKKISKSSNGPILFSFTGTPWPDETSSGDDYVCSSVDSSFSANEEIGGKMEYRENKDKSVHNERITLKIKKIKRLKGRNEARSDGVYRVAKTRISKKRKVSPENNTYKSNPKKPNRSPTELACERVIYRIYPLRTLFEIVTVDSIDCVLPKTVLLKIFKEMIAQDESPVLTLTNLCRVCEDWRQLILSSSNLWERLDFSPYSDINTKITGYDLSTFCENVSLKNVKYANFTGWTRCLTYVSFTKFLDTVGLTLRSLVLKGCTELCGNDLVMIADKCPQLQEIDLSRTVHLKGIQKKSESSGGRPGEKKNPIFSNSFNYFLSKCGSNLSSLLLAENKINRSIAIINNIMNSCPNLQLLDLSNIEDNAEYPLPIHKLQKSCPHLRVLRLANVSLNCNHPCAEGFPNLEELSIPCNTYFVTMANSDIIISNLTKNAENLKLLDIRGLRKVSASCLIKIPSWNLQNLAVDSCTDGLGLVISKWKHSLVEVDLSRNSNREAMNSALESLASEKNNCLRSLNLRGSSVSFDLIKKVLNNCNQLVSIDLQSCRALPRGTKRAFEGNDFMQFRKNALDGRYDEFDV